MSFSAHNQQFLFLCVSSEIEKMSDSKISQTPGVNFKGDVL